jgi:hypothetical protein
MPKMECNMERRRYTRKFLDPIHVTEIKLVDRSLVVARYGTILNASATGLLIRTSRSDLHPEILQHTSPLETIEGKQAVMKIVEMELEIGGRIVRIRQAEQEAFEIAIDFTENAPTYWRECLVELLPSLGEIAPVDSSWASDLQVVKGVRPL